MRTKRKGRASAGNQSAAANGSARFNTPFAIDCTTHCRDGSSPTDFEKSRLGGHAVAVADFALRRFVELAREIDLLPMDDGGWIDCLVLRVWAEAPRHNWPKCLQGKECQEYQE